MFFSFFATFTEIVKLGPVPRTRIKARFTSLGHIWIKGLETKKYFGPTTNKLCMQNSQTESGSDTQHGSGDKGHFI